MSGVIDDAFQQATEIEKKIKEFFDAVNSVLNWVPGFLDHLIEPIQAGMEKINQKIMEFWSEVKEFLDNTGNPDKLEQLAEAWRDQVGNPTGEIAGDIALEKLATNTEWTGSGAAAYKAIVPAQSDGLNGIKTLSVDFSTMLKDLANGIENFWIAIGFAFGSLVVGFAAAIIEAATVVAIPGAIATVIGALGVAITAIGVAVMEIKTIYDTIDTSQDAIDQGLTDLGQEWSKATPVNQGKMDDTQQWERM